MIFAQTPYFREQGTKSLVRIGQGRSIRERWSKMGINCSNPVFFTAKWVGNIAVMLVINKAGNSISEGAGVLAGSNAGSWLAFIIA